MVVGSRCDRLDAMIAMMRRARCAARVNLQPWPIDPDPSKLETTLTLRDGLRRLIGNILAVNTPMCTLATVLGFAIHADPEDARHVIATLALAPD